MSRNEKYKNNWRIYFFIMFLLGISLIVFLRLYNLQVTQHQNFRNIAQDQHYILQELTPKRGEVYIKEGEDLYPLAVNREYQMLFISPKEVESDDEVIEIISKIVNIDKQEIQDKLSNKKSAFKVIKHKLSQEEIDKLKEVDLKGVHLSAEVFRYYPANELASQVIGFVGSDGDDTKGMYGIEAYWDEELSGSKGVLQQERDSKGGWISIADRLFTPATDGVDLVLTLDHTIQFEVEKILKEAIEKHSADEGSIIVMDPFTGKILAMANYPNFNPNEYSKVNDMLQYMNHIVNSPYEPGSVFKTITAAMAIDDGKISPETKYYDSGQVVEAGYVIKNSDEKSYGEVTMTQMLEDSLNTGAIFAQKQIGNKKFYEYMKLFGFGEKTGINLPGELGGNISNLNNFNQDINFYTASFGQGITTTPLQLATSYSVIANGGMLLKPQVVDSFIKSNEERKKLEQEEIRRVISKDAAWQTSKMLRSVVVNGHGKQAGVEGYSVCGKTGTAQVAKSDSKGYEEGLTIGTFAGFAPINDAKAVVVVKIVNPKDVQWAESTAAPAFSRVMKFILEYYNVEPTEFNYADDEK